MSKQKLGLIALAAVLVVTGSAAAAHRKHSAQRHSSGTTVELHKTALGKVLATSAGRTLYLYTPDGRNKSNCNGGCASIWPPLVAKGKLHAAAGVQAKLLGTARRSDGKRQVTYKGHPLYTYSGDSKSGQTNGEAYGGIWYALNGSGNKVQPKQSGGTTTGGGGYY